MISDFSPFYPKRLFPVFPVPVRVVELTLRKQVADVTFWGPHLVLVLSGVVCLSASDATKDAPEGSFSAGQVYFSKSSCSYKVSAGSAAVGSLCIYGFEDKMVPHSLFSHLQPVSRFPASTLSHLTESVNDALKKDPVWGDLTAAGLLYPFLLSLAARAPYAGHPPDTKSSSREARFDPTSPLRHALDYISRNYSTPIGAADIEQAVVTLETPRTHLSRLFEDAFGLRPIEYLQQYRLHRAALLLERTDTSLECIARECGFSGRSYLSAVFTKHHGESPTAYRKRHTCASHTHQRKN